LVKKIGAKILIFDLRKQNELSALGQKIQIFSTKSLFSFAKKSAGRKLAVPMGPYS